MVIDTRRNLEMVVVQNGKFRSRPLALPATNNTGKTGSCRGTTGTASVPVNHRNVSWLKNHSDRGC